MIEEDSLQNGEEGRIWGPPGCGKTTYVSKADRKSGADASTALVVFL